MVGGLKFGRGLPAHRAAWPIALALCFESGEWSEYSKKVTSKATAGHFLNMRCPLYMLWMISDIVLSLDSSMLIQQIPPDLEAATLDKETFLMHRMLAKQGVRL